MSSSSSPLRASPKASPKASPRASPLKAGSRAKAKAPPPLVRAHTTAAGLDQHTDAPLSRSDRRNSGTSAFFKKASLRNVLKSTSRRNSVSSASQHVADISSPAALLTALRQARLGAENLICLGSLPKVKPAAWLGEFVAADGLAVLLSYMKDARRNTDDRELRVLMLRQSAMFLAALLRHFPSRAGDDGGGDALDACAALWRVFDAQPALLVACVRLLRYDAGASSNASAVLVDFRVSLCGVLEQLLRALERGASESEKVNVVLTAGLFPTLLWLRQRLWMHEGLNAAAMRLERAAFLLHERAVGDTVQQLARLGGDETVYVELNGEAACVAAAAESGARVAAARRSAAAARSKNTVRVLLGVFSHVGVVRVAYDAKSTVASLKHAALAAASESLLDNLTVGSVRARTASDATSLSAPSDDATPTHSTDTSTPQHAELASSVAAQFGLKPVDGAEDSLFDESKTLKKLGIEADALVELCRRPYAVQVDVLLDGGLPSVALEYDMLEYVTVDDVQKTCEYRIKHDEAASCRIFAATGPLGLYEPIDRSVVLAQLPRDVPLQYKREPRPAKIEYKDGTFVFVNVSEGMRVKQLMYQLAKKRSIAASRLVDYGVYVDAAPAGEEPAAADGDSESGFWLDDDARGVDYLFHRADEHLSVRFIPRAHRVSVDLALQRRDDEAGAAADKDGGEKGGDGKASAAETEPNVADFHGKAFDVFFDVPVSAVIARLCDQIGLTTLAPSRLCIVVHRASDSAASTPKKKKSKKSKSDAATASTAALKAQAADSNGSDDTALATWISLRSQGVTTNDTLELRRVAESSTMDPNRINVWKEEETVDTVRYSEEANPTTQERDIVAASLNQLVVHLTSASAHNASFANTFHYSYRTLASPEVLLRKFVERFDVPPSVEENEAFIVQTQVCITIKRWLELFVRCASDPTSAVLDAVEQFVDKSVAKSVRSERIAPLLMRQIEAARTELAAALVDRAAVDAVQAEDDAAAARKAEATANSDANGAAAAANGGDSPGAASTPTGSPSTMRRQSSVSRRTPKNMAAMLGMSLMSIDIDELARNITYHDFALFSKIEPREYFNSAWTRKQRSLAPNLRAFIDRFNYLSSWVSSAIVEESLLRERARVFERFVHLMSALHTLQNFSAIMAIISGLNNSALLRLKWTREKLTKRTAHTLTHFESMMNMEGSFQRYRKELTRCAPPCIPYVGVALMDLTFIDEGNPDQIGPLINFAKRRMVVDVVLKLEACASASYDIEPSVELEAFFKNLPQLSDKELYARSLSVEPRGVADIKEIK